MRRILFFTLLLASVLTMQAQKPVAYLFEAFEPGTLWLNDYSHVTIPFNYDAANHLLLYKQEGTLMELENNANVDSITIGGRLFIPMRERFVEYVPLADGHFVLVDWTLKEKYSAYREGAVINPRTIVDVQTVNVGALYARQPDTETDNHIYIRENRNEYTLVYHDKRVTFRSRKAFLRAFPDHSNELKTYIRQQLLDFAIPADVFRAVEYLYTLDAKE